MSEEITQDLPNGDLKLILAHLHSINARLGTLNDQSFDNSDFSDFSHSGGDSRKLPAHSRRRRPPAPPLSKRTVWLPNVANRPQGGPIAAAAPLEFGQDGGGTKCSAVAVLVKLLARAEHQLFHLVAGAVMNPWGWAVVVAAMHALKALIGGAGKPSLDLGGRNGKAASERAFLRS